MRDCKMLSLKEDQVNKITILSTVHIWVNNIFVKAVDVKESTTQEKWKEER